MHSSGNAATLETALYKHGDRASVWRPCYPLLTPISSAQDGLSY